MGDELSDATIRADGGGRLETAGEGVHPANVRVEQVGRRVRFPPPLGVEIQPALPESAHAEHREHDIHGEINVGRELICVPTDEFVAPVCVD